MNFEQAFRIGARLQGVTRLGFAPTDVAGVAEEVVQRYREVPQEKVSEIVLNACRYMPTPLWYNGKRWELSDWRSQMFSSVHRYIELGAEWRPSRFRIIQGGEPKAARATPQRYRPLPGRCAESVLELVTGDDE